MKPFIQGLFIKLLEAFHARAMGHHYYTFHDLFFVLTDKFESKEEKEFEMFENV
jgi:hypothetical protein